MSGRMIFPYEELPEDEFPHEELSEDETGELLYQEVFGGPNVYPRTLWTQSVYDGVMAQFHKVKAESKLVGCPVVMDFEDGRRSSGTITGVGDVKYDHGKLLSYVLTVEEFPRWSPTTAPKRVMHRASPGLRKPRPVNGMAFGWDRSRGMYSEALSMNLRSIEDWRKSLEEYRSQFSWLGAF